MKMNELRQKSKEELVDLIGKKRARIDELIFLLRKRGMKNVKEIGMIKKDIARMQTAIALQS